jgi:hypothetical protein
MSETEHTCLVCDRTKEEIPLITLDYRDQHYYICPQHFPILIHHPEQLTGKLPGAENLEAHNH